MKVIWYPAVSLDGFISDAHGSADWISPEDTRHLGELVVSTGAIIVGRRTYDQYHRPNPFPAVRTYVLTRDTSLVSDDPAVVYVSGGPLEIMRRLHADGHLAVVLAGGGTVNGLFAAANLIDEAWVSIYPLVHGNGTPMLGGYQGSLRLTWKQGFLLPGGIVHNRYDVG